MSCESKFVDDADPQACRHRRKDPARNDLDSGLVGRQPLADGTDGGQDHRGGADLCEPGVNVMTKFTRGN